MKKLKLLMHTSLDGFIAGPTGEMDWILFDEEMGDYSSSLTQGADTVIYGRITFQMMESYWPTAGESAGASRHDKEHAAWVNKARKMVFSRTVLTSDWNNTVFYDGNIDGTVSALKKEDGGDILLIGSASITHALIQADLIDEYRININPVILGIGIPLFKNIRERMNLVLTGTRQFRCGVTGLTYIRKSD